MFLFGPQTRRTNGSLTGQKEKTMTATVTQRGGEQAPDTTAIRQFWMIGPGSGTDHIPSIFRRRINSAEVTALAIR